MKLIPNLAPIDRKAVEDCGIASLTLMENAGQQVALEVHHVLSGNFRSVVTILCGRGNNAGDGFVCAKYLQQMGYQKICVVTMALESDLSHDARTNFKLLPSSVQIISAFQHLPQTLQVQLDQSDILVDALFGSGLARSIEGHYRDVIDMMNQSSAVILAIDLPSGINSETGAIMGIAVKADYTVTFAVSKPGLHLIPGKAYAGLVKVVDIGIPKTLIESDLSRIELLSAEMVKQLLPKRSLISHKYMYGSVLVIAGSRAMPGAAVMTAEAALRAGVGIVTLAAPESAFLSMQLRPEIIRLPLPETEQGVIVPAAIEILQPVLQKVTTIAIGPGLTTQEQAVCFVQSFLIMLRDNFSGQVVIDADGLNALSLLSPSPQLSASFILTPHLGEAARLLGTGKRLLENNLLSAGCTMMERYQAAVVLKSASTVIVDLDKRFWINSTGNPGMATAGSGDVLTGLIAGFAAQGLSPQEAAIVGVYLHGLAGDKAAEALTEYCLTATDILHYLPGAIKAVLG